MAALGPAVESIPGKAMVSTSLQPCYDVRNGREY